MVAQQVVPPPCSTRIPCLSLAELQPGEWGMNQLMEDLSQSYLSNEQIYLPVKKEKQYHTVGFSYCGVPRSERDLEVARGYCPNILTCRDERG